MHAKYFNTYLFQPNKLGNHKSKWYQFEWFFSFDVVHAWIFLYKDVRHAVRGKCHGWNSQRDRTTVYVAGLASRPYNQHRSCWGSHQWGLWAWISSGLVLITLERSCISGHISNLSSKQCIGEHLSHILMFPVYGIPHSCTYVYNYLYLLGTHAMANNCVLETAAKLVGVGFDLH